MTDDQIKNQWLGLLSKVIALAIKTKFYTIIPVLSSLLTGIIGYFTNVPLFWIWLGVLVAFSYTASGLLRFDEWLYRRRVQDKLVFESVLVGNDISHQGINIGVLVRSTATFPVEFEIKSFRTQLGPAAPEGRYSKQKITVQSNGLGFAYDNLIRIPSSPQNIMKGSIEFTVSYGKPGSTLQYSISGKKESLLSFNEQGVSVNQATLWIDTI